MNNKEFEPAFPILDDDNGLGLHLRHSGMCLRDYFAASIIQGICASSPAIAWTDDLLAREA